MVCVSGEHEFPEERAPRIPLTFSEVAVINRSRSTRWHAKGTEPWTGADWSNAMCGEAGEAANVVKKLRRAETGMAGARDPHPTVLVEDLADELADTFLYLDLVADHYGIDLAKAIVSKFNRVSDREGFAERLYL